jgi:spore germination cell wall hydrolase CwlJ-like protein
VAVAKRWISALLCLLIGAQPAQSSELAGTAELLDLARTIHGEAAGESREGMLAVGFVVLNRIAVDPDRWGHTVSQVVRRNRQFSVWGSAARRRKLMALTDATPGFVSAKAAAALVLRRAVRDPTGGATHFVSTRIRPPRWTHGMTAIRLGGHVFYKRGR